MKSKTDFLDTKGNSEKRNYLVTKMCFGTKAATAALKRLNVEQIKQTKQNEAKESIFDFEMPKLPQISATMVVCDNNGPTFNFMTNSTNSTSFYFTQS